MAVVEKAVSGAFAEVEKHAPEEFKELLQADPHKREAFRQAVKEAAEEEVRLAAEFSKKAGYTAEEVAKILGKHYSEHRLELVKTALQVPTYRLDITKQDGKHRVDITRGEKKFMEPVHLGSVADVDTTNWIQMASIIVEAVLLVLQAVGIDVEVSDSIILKTAQEIAADIQKSIALQQDIEAIKKAAQDGSKEEIAKAIFNLIKDLYGDGILWEIIKGLCSNMSKLDWIKTAGVVTAMIIATLATDGAALIAKILLALASAYDFMKKLTNLSELEAIRETL